MRIKTIQEMFGGLLDECPKCCYCGEKIKQNDELEYWSPFNRRNENGNICVFHSKCNI